MNENVHRYLDGDLPRSAVPLPEQQTLRETDEAIAAARSWVRSQPVPDIASRVMAALPDESFGMAGSIRAAGSSEGPALGAGAEVDPVSTVPVVAAAPATPRRSPLEAVVEGLRWIWTPRPIAVRPAMAGAFMLVLLVAVARPGQTPAPAADPVATGAATPIYIQFRLDTPDASDVALAGTFTEWQPAYSLHESAPGVWTVTVPLEPGVHDYLFIVDGERWVPDPAATPVDDGFGGTNSRLLLSVPRNEA
jgi:hypothetical protein